MGTSRICKCIKKENDDNKELNTEKDFNKSSNEYTKNIEPTQYVTKDSLEFSINKSIHNQNTLPLTNFQETSDKPEICRSSIDRNLIKSYFNEDENNNEYDDRLYSYEFQEPTPLRHSKKQLIYTNTCNNPPLEIINELNTESFNESPKMSEEKRKKLDNHNKYSEFKMELINENEQKEKESLDNQEIELNTDKNQNESYIRKKKYDINFVKKTGDNKNVDINDAWKNILITNLIPESKLLSDNDDELMYQSNLEKFTANPNMRNRCTYITRFCLITKKELRYYKNKECFLTLQNPMLRIPIQNIAYSRRIIFQDEKKNSLYQKNSLNNCHLHHFYIQMNVNLDESVSKQLAWSSEDDSITGIQSKKKKFIQLSHEQHIPKDTNYKNSHQLNRPEDKLQSRSKRITLIDHSLNLELQNSMKQKQCLDKNKINIFSQDIYIFASENESLVNNWVSILNYFSKKL